MHANNMKKTTAILAPPAFLLRVGTIGITECLQQGHLPFVRKTGPFEQIVHAIHFRLGKTFLLS